MKGLKFVIISLLFSFSSCDHSSDENDREQNSAASGKDEINMCTFDLTNLPDNSTSKLKSAIVTFPKWKTGQTIKIKFLDGEIWEHELVKKYASQWTSYANLKLEYVNINEDAQIRIGFNVGKTGAWSVLGMSRIYEQNVQTMRLGSLKVAKEEWAARTILHEFGHALGLVHEHQSPAAKINWNLPKIYAYYNAIGYDNSYVDKEIVKKYDADRTNYSEYDPLSIMHYDIDPAFTFDEVRLGIKNELSNIDKKYINKWYPFSIVSILDSGQSIPDLPWNKRIKSPNGKYSLEFNSGLLQVIDLTDDKVIWEAGDYNYRRKPSCYFESTTGNIIIKGARVSSSATIVTWTSNTSGFPGAKLYLQDNGDLQLIYNDIVRWSSKNGKL